MHCRVIWSSFNSRRPRKCRSIRLLLFYYRDWYQFLGIEFTRLPNNISEPLESFHRMQILQHNMIILLYSTIIGILPSDNLLLLLIGTLYINSKGMFFCSGLLVTVWTTFVTNNGCTFKLICTDALETEWISTTWIAIQVEKAYIYAISEPLLPIKKNHTIKKFTMRSFSQHSIDRILEDMYTQGRRSYAR